MTPDNWSGKRRTTGNAVMTPLGGGQEAELPGMTALPGNHYPLVLRLLVTTKLAPTIEISASATTGKNKTKTKYPLDRAR